MDFCYMFPVVKGLQARREYYIAMVPMKMLSKIFTVDDEYVLPEFRAQRKLNQSRIPEISRYIIENRDDYVFSALSASIDGKIEYQPSTDNVNIGMLKVDMNSRFLINDGQHRFAAIRQALMDDDSLEDETISIVFFEDKGLERSQQIFTDLNKHAVKTSNSISELYDSRDALAVTTRRVISKINFLNKYTDKEKDILGKYSSNLFTLNTFYNANKRIVGKINLSKEEESFLLNFWGKVVENISQWQEMDNKLISKVELRETYIITQAVVIQAIARVGNCFYRDSKLGMNEILKLLGNIDWRRNAECWKLRTIRDNGRMINSEKAILLTANVIKTALGLSLTKEEQDKEKKFSLLRK